MTITRSSAASSSLSSSSSHSSSTKVTSNKKINSITTATTAITAITTPKDSDDSVKNDKNSMSAISSPRRTTRSSTSNVRRPPKKLPYHHRHENVDDPEGKDDNDMASSGNLVTPQAPVSTGKLSTNTNAEPTSSLDANNINCSPNTNTNADTSVQKNFASDANKEIDSAVSKNIDTIDKSPNAKSTLNNDAKKNIPSAPTIAEKTTTDTKPASESAEEIRRKKIMDAARAFALAPSPAPSKKKSSRGKPRKKSTSVLMAPPPPVSSSSLPLHHSNMSIYESSASGVPSNHLMTPNSSSKINSMHYSLTSPLHSLPMSSNRKKEQLHLMTTPSAAHPTSIATHPGTPTSLNMATMPQHLSNHATQSSAPKYNIHHLRANPLKTTSIIAAAHKYSNQEDEEEDEYAKFVKSLCDTSDLASIISFPVPEDDDDDDEASYQLPEDEEDEDDFDETFDSANGNAIFDMDDLKSNESSLKSSREQSSQINPSSEMNSPFKQKQSSKELDSNHLTNATSLSSLIEKTKCLSPPSPVNNDISVSESNDKSSSITSLLQHDKIDYNELEEELGNLMEEDIEATLATLLQQPMQNTSSASISPPTHTHLPKDLSHNTFLSSSQEYMASTPNIKNSKQSVPSPSSLLSHSKSAKHHPIMMASSPLYASTNNMTSASPSIARQRKHKVVAAAARATSTILPSSTLAPLTPTTKFDSLKPSQPSNPTTYNNHSYSYPHSGATGVGAAHSAAPNICTPFSASQDPTSPNTTLSSTASHSDGSVSIHHITQLHSLMKQHYQLLLQQSILAVRSAHQYKKEKEKISKDRARAKKSQNDAKNNKAINGTPNSSQQANNQKAKRNTTIPIGETQDEITEILDGAVVMLQDLEQNRKDSIRNFNMMVHVSSLQSHSSLSSSSSHPSFSNLSSAQTNNKLEQHQLQQVQHRRLTRSAFIKTLQERDGVFHTSSSSPFVWNGSHYVKRNLDLSPLSSNEIAFRKAMSIFDVKGLGRLVDTFSTLDNSVNRNGKVNILEMANHSDACLFLLQQAGAKIDHNLIPGKRDLSELLTFPKECFGDFTVPLSQEQQLELKQNRSQFSASEDNLLLRGVNLFGEKEWASVSDRYLPDRSLTFISQRYARLCFLLYIAHGIHIDEEGNLDTPPEHPDGVANFDEEAISKLQVVEEPYKYNVHRWSLVEDITILKSVPLMGRMWAEITNRLIKHRNRGHIRKRYQVLERRVKGAIKRDKKINIGSLVCSSPRNSLTAVVTMTPNIVSGESDMSNATPDAKNNGLLLKSTRTKRDNPGSDSTSLGYNNPPGTTQNKLCMEPLTKKRAVSRASPTPIVSSRLPPRMLPMASTMTSTSSITDSTKSHKSSVILRQQSNTNALNYASMTSNQRSAPNTPLTYQNNEHSSNNNMPIQGTPIHSSHRASFSGTNGSKDNSHSNINMIDTPSSLICDEQMVSLPAHSNASFLDASTPSKLQLIFTPSSDMKSNLGTPTSLSSSFYRENLNSNLFKSAKRSFKCSPPSLPPPLVQNSQNQIQPLRQPSSSLKSQQKENTSSGFERILNENQIGERTNDVSGGLSMMSQMNKWMNGASPKSPLGISHGEQSNWRISEMSSHMIASGVVGDTDTPGMVGSNLLPSMPMDPANFSNFSILNDLPSTMTATNMDINTTKPSGKDDASKTGTKTNMTNPPPARQTLMKAVMAKSKEGSNDLHHRSEMEATSSPPLGDMSGLSFVRLDGVNNINGSSNNLNSLEQQATDMDFAMKLTTGEDGGIGGGNSSTHMMKDLSMGGFSDFGMNSFHVSDRSRQMFEGTSHKSPLHTITARPPLPLTESNWKDVKDGQIDLNNDSHSSSHIEVANVLSSLSNSSSKVFQSISNSTTKSSNTKTQKSFFSKVVGSADEKTTKRQRKEL